MPPHIFDVVFLHLRPREISPFWASGRPFLTNRCRNARLSRHDTRVRRQLPWPAIEGEVTLLLLHIIRFHVTICFHNSGKRCGKRKPSYCRYSRNPSHHSIRDNGFQTRPVVPELWSRVSFNLSLSSFCNPVKEGCVCFKRAPQRALAEANPLRQAVPSHRQRRTNAW